MATLKDILSEVAKDYSVPTQTEKKILAIINGEEDEPEVVDAMLYDGDYPPFGTDISELI